MEKNSIPRPVAAVVGQVIGDHYYSHRRLENLFWESGAKGDPPPGNCAEKVERWLLRESSESPSNAHTVLGKILENYMEVDASFGGTAKSQGAGRKRINDILATYGLSYSRGGGILDATGTIPKKSLEDILRAGDLVGVSTEFDRARDGITSNPRDSITAACAILEALCKIYIADEQLTLPPKQSIKPLWAIVQKHLELDPASLQDKDLSQILSGLTSVVDGIGSLRTHVGSAHGYGRVTYRPATRHARLAVNAAFTLTTFLLETWEQRKVEKKQSTI